MTRGFPATFIGETFAVYLAKTKAVIPLKDSMVSNRTLSKNTLSVTIALKKRTTVLYSEWPFLICIPILSVMYENLFYLP